MIRSISFTLILSFFVFGLAVPSLRAEEGKKVLFDTKIVFDGAGKGKVDYQNHGLPADKLMGYKIQSSLMYYAFVMNQIEDAQRIPLMNQVQRIVTAVATEGGLVKADILKNNEILKLAKGETQGKGFDLSFTEIPKRGNGLEVKPVGDNPSLMAPSVFYLFQDIINHGSDNGLRLMVLAIGGMNKWYREIGKAADPNSVSIAPTYGLNLAVDIISQISGKKI